MLTINRKIFMNGSMVLNLFLSTAIVFFISVQEARATPFASVNELCARYEGRVVGTRDGQQVRISCPQIQRMWESVPQFVPKPFFHEFRDNIRHMRNADFAEVIRTQFASSMQCSRDRLTTENRYSCQAPLGLQNSIVLTLNSRNRIESAHITVDGAILNPAMQNMSARIGIANFTSELRELVLHMATMHIRRISQSDELYSTDGRTLRVEIWPWRQP